MLPPLRVAIERCREQTPAEWCKVPRLKNKTIREKVASLSAVSAKKFIHMPKKGPWSKQEDKCLMTLATQFKARDWILIAQSFQNKTVKQCRDRWHNQLNPTIDHSPWSKAEEQLLTRAQSQVGNRWASIAKLFPGRTASNVKNRYNSALRRRQNY